MNQFSKLWLIVAPFLFDARPPWGYNNKLLIAVGAQKEDDEGKTYVMKCSNDRCNTFFEEKVVDGCTKMSDATSLAFTFDSNEDFGLVFYDDEECTSFLSSTDYDPTDTAVVCSLPGTVINPCGTDVGYKIFVQGEEGADSSTSSVTGATPTSYDGSLGEFVMQCFASDDCDTVVEEKLINGCTKMSAPTGQYFAFDPTALDREYASFEDSQCTSSKITTSYNVDDAKDTICIKPVGDFMIPCGIDTPWRITTKQMVEDTSNQGDNVKDADPDATDDSKSSASSSSAKEAILSTALTFNHILSLLTAVTSIHFWFG